MNNQELDKEKISEVITSLLSGIDKENAELYAAILDKNKRSVDLADKDYESFFFGLVYPYQKFLRTLIAHKTGGKCSNPRHLEFLLLNSQYVERHYLKLIQKYEGGSCSVDKSRSIMRKLTTFFKDNQATEWDLEQEYTYQIPEKVFTTHESIITFFEAIKSLHVGNVEKYMKWIEINLLPLNQEEDAN